MNIFKAEIFPIWQKFKIFVQFKMLKMSKRRLFPKPVCQITVNNEPVESAMVKGIPASSFFESSKSDRWRRLAFKSRIELDFFDNFVKKRSFK